MAITTYCTVSDIEGWFPGVTFSTSTKIKLAKVESLIERHSATIDNRLSKAYTVPITGEYSLSVVKEICEYMTIADVNDIVKQGLGKHSDRQNPTDYRKLAEDKLAAIISGKVELTDANAKESYDFYSYNYSNDVEATIDKDKEQW